MMGGRLRHRDLLSNLSSQQVSNRLRKQPWQLSEIPIALTLSLRPKNVQLCNAAINSWGAGQADALGALQSFLWVVEVECCGSSYFTLGLCLDTFIKPYELVKIHGFSV